MDSYRMRSRKRCSFNSFHGAQKYQKIIFKVASWEWAQWRTWRAKMLKMPHHLVSRPIEWNHSFVVITSLENHNKWQGISCRRRGGAWKKSSKPVPQGRPNGFPTLKPKWTCLTARHPWFISMMRFESVHVSGLMLRCVQPAGLIFLVHCVVDSTRVLLCHTLFQIWHSTRFVEATILSVPKNEYMMVDSSKPKPHYGISLVKEPPDGPLKESSPFLKAGQTLGSLDWLLAGWKLLIWVCKKPWSRLFVSSSQETKVRMVVISQNR